MALLSWSITIRVLEEKYFVTCITDLQPYQFARSQILCYPSAFHSITN
jgi:hypothetical protein